jgi:hypothetical protein
MASGRTPKSKIMRKNCQMKRGHIIKKEIIIILCWALCLIGCRNFGVEQTKTGWYQDQLVGRVKTLRAESAKLTDESGKSNQGQHGVAVVKNYGTNGLINNEEHYHPNGSLLWSVSYIYSDNGYKKERVLYAPNGSQREKTIYNYDKGGNLVEEANYRDENSLHSRIAYAYDEDNNRIESQAYNGRGAFSDKWIYAYNERGIKKQEGRYYADGSLDTKYVYAFDNKGNGIERLKYNSKDELLEKEKYEYEFDGKGNWIKKITSKMIEGTNQKAYEAVEATYRTITYFE